MTKQLQLRSVNKAIAKTGLELVKGNGYFYFIGEGTESLYSASVMVCSLNEMSLERWVEEANGKAKEIAEM
jgi:hypothetical protein